MNSRSDGIISEYFSRLVFKMVVTLNNRLDGMILLAIGYCPTISKTITSIKSFGTELGGYFYIILSAIFQDAIQSTKPKKIYWKSFKIMFRSCVLYIYRQKLLFNFSFTNWVIKGDTMLFNRNISVRSLSRTMYKSFIFFVIHYRTLWYVTAHWTL